MINELTLQDILIVIFVAVFVILTIYTIFFSVTDM
jgi:hypothetical protein